MDWFTISSQLNQLNKLFLSLAFVIYELSDNFLLNFLKFENWYSKVRLKLSVTRVGERGNDRITENYV